MTHRDFSEYRNEPGSFLEQFEDTSTMMVMLRDVALACISTLTILAIVIVVATWPAAA